MFGDTGGVMGTERIYWTQVPTLPNSKCLGVVVQRGGRGRHKGVVGGFLFNYSDTDVELLWSRVLWQVLRV